MKRKVEVYLIDEALTEYGKLNEMVGAQKAKGVTDSIEIQLLNSIKKKKEFLESNPEYGNKIPRKLIPKKLIEKHNLTNLWRLELTKNWRMLYTLRGDKVEVICFVINIMNHKKYSKLFGYKK